MVETEEVASGVEEEAGSEVDMETEEVGMVIGVGTVVEEEGLGTELMVLQMVLHEGQGEDMAAVEVGMVVEAGGTVTTGVHRETPTTSLYLREAVGTVTGMVGVQAEEVGMGVGRNDHMRVVGTMSRGRGGGID